MRGVLSYQLDTLLISYVSPSKLPGAHGTPMKRYETFLATILIIHAEYLSFLFTLIITMSYTHRLEDMLLAIKD